MAKVSIINIEDVCVRASAISDLKLDTDNFSRIGHGEQRASIAMAKCLSKVFAGIVDELHILHPGRL
ncbi:hypothetical protein ALQ95_200154 [Pseudomonas syringae pv. ribicola]|uniref:Uncharacterized protein n=1 Tax=Pseudomonas syringae pv. ribicola TaxID=55398 RepID=A0A3M2VMN2_PSESI|nr:hypothetical protein ALQ95_200154 [Pseudomonas syringae pv. ribicola]